MDLEDYRYMQQLFYEDWHDNTDQLMYSMAIEPDVIISAYSEDSRNPEVVKWFKDMAADMAAGSKKKG